MLPGNCQIPQTIPPVLACIVSEMRAAGVRVTPLGIVAALTDRGADDEEVATAVECLMSAGTIEAAAR